MDCGVSEEVDFGYGTKWGSDLKRKKASLANSTHFFKMLYLCPKQAENYSLLRIITASVVSANSSN